MMTLMDTSAYPPVRLLDHAMMRMSWLYLVPSGCWPEPFDWPEDRNWWELVRINEAYTA